MRGAVLAVVLVLAACGNSATPQARSSLPPSATPTPAAGSPLTWAAAVLVDHQPPFEGNRINRVSCSSSSLCVAVEYADVITSSNPTAGAAAWTVTNLDGFSGIPYLSDVSCPSDRLCVAIDSNGSAVATSTNPTGGAAAWTLTKVAGAQGLSGLSCPSITLCVAVDGGGNAITSSNPAGGAATWSATHVDGPAVCVRGEGSLPCGMHSVSCPTSNLCVAVDSTGVVTSKNPTGGAAAWKATPVAGVFYIGGVSCPSVTLCVAFGGGDVVTSTNPTGGAAAWKVTHVTASHNLTSVSCPSSTLCIGVDDYGDVITSTNPSGGAAAWRLTNVDSNNEAIANGVGVALNGVSCPSSTLCVAVDDLGNAVTSTNPTGGAAAWTVPTLTARISCKACRVPPAASASPWITSATSLLLTTPPEGPRPGL